MLLQILCVGIPRVYELWDSSAYLVNILATNGKQQTLSKSRNMTIAIN